LNSGYYRVTPKLGLLAKFVKQLARARRSIPPM
jgi:hypothetical protein